jgi:hypothetical protein
VSVVSLVIIDCALIQRRTLVLASYSRKTPSPILAKATYAFVTLDREIHPNSLTSHDGETEVFPLFSYLVILQKGGDWPNSVLGSLS